MEEITEKILQVLNKAEKSLSPSEIAAAIDNQSACDIDRQRMDTIRQTLMKLVGDGSIDFEALEPMRVAGPDGESGPTFGACFRALDLLDKFRRERLARLAREDAEREDIVA